MTGDADRSAADPPRRTQAWHVAVAGGAFVVAALLVLWDWNWFKYVVERRVAAATGREFSIEGPLDVDLGRTVVVRAEDLSLANTTWSLTPEMAKADLLRVEIPLGSLLRGRWALRRVDLVRPALLLERNRRGSANWKFDRPARRGRAWSFGELRVHDGQLDVRDLPLDTHLQLTVDSATPEPGADHVRLRLRGSGRYRGHPFRLDGWADSPVALFAPSEAAYRVDFSARAGATRARAHGALDVPFDPARFGVDMELRGNDLGELYPLVGLAMPATPPYAVAFEFDRNGHVLRLRSLAGRIGDSDLSGQVAIDLGGPRPVLDGDLVSTHLDLDDLGGTIGLPPDVGPDESASPEQVAAAARHEARPRLLPDREYDLRKLASMDADVQMRADEVDAGKWPVESLAFTLRLRDAVLQLEPFEVEFGGGRFVGATTLDAREATIGATADVAVHGLDLARLFPQMEPANVGRINGTIDLQGRGNSVADMFATASGEVQLGMGRGRFSNLLLELAGLDVAESLKFLLSNDRTVPLRCAWGDFAFEQGRAHARSLVFDTTDTVVFGQGTIDFTGETLDLELRPAPKDVSPVSLRGPLRVGGTFKDPSFRPEGKSLLARAAVAAALYAIAPPAALLAFVEIGPGEDVDCFQGKKKEKSREAGKTAEPSPPQPAPHVPG